MNTSKLSSFLLIASLMLGNMSAGQDKPLIDTGMLGSWPRINGYSVMMSPDGLYVAYVIQNQPLGKSTLVLQSLRGNLEKKELVAARPEPLFFSADGRLLCWRAGDSIFLQNTGGHQENRLLGSAGTVTYPACKNGRWVITGSLPTGLRLLYLMRSKEKVFATVRQADWSPDGNHLALMGERKKGVGELRLVTLSTGKEQVFAAVRFYDWSPEGKALVLVMETAGIPQVLWYSMSTRTSCTIWTGRSGQMVNKLVFDKKGQQLAFVVSEGNGKEVNNTIWQYEAGRPQAELRMNNSTPGIPTGLGVVEPRSFSGNGRWLMVTLRKTLPVLQRQPGAVPVDIWSYRDEVLFPAQATNLPAYKDYTAMMPAAGGILWPLENDEEKIGEVSENDQVLIYQGGSASSGRTEGHRFPAMVWLLSMDEREKKRVKSEGRYNGTAYMFSPDGRWLWYWVPGEGNYYSINPATGRTNNLTGGLPVSVANETLQTVENVPVGIAGWYEQDSAILIYDNYDIWRIDPAGRKEPVNLTGGYGYQHQIKLRLVYNVQRALRGTEELLLTGYSRKTGENGFFKLRLDRPGIPELLTMGPYTYYHVETQKEHGYSFGDGMPPVAGGKGKDQRWVVLRQNATEYPNLFVSKDLKSFVPLTNLQPQKEYNWLTAERLTWTMPNGMENRGILYKPENFDSTKKYPVIFNYYEKLSHRINQFPQPGLTSSNINIPWFVSRGYLVCTPDIQFTVAVSEGGYSVTEAATMSVVSAARYLAQRSYVDSARMAIQGHSFGALQTNGIITQTNLFAAAAVMAGTSDPVSSYLTLVGKEGREFAHKQDHPQGRIGATPWERPDIYLRVSAVLNADRISTPLFIVHNHKDEAVNFRQGVEMYMALRRLGKPCWLLQYDNSSHGLDDIADAMDYTIRLTQYFDHYLKGRPVPRWISGNNLAPYKGIANLYETDPEGICGKQCKVCNAH